MYENRVILPLSLRVKAVEQAVEYCKSRDPIALDYLPKLLN